MSRRISGPTRKRTRRRHTTRHTTRRTTEPIDYHMGGSMHSRHKKKFAKLSPKLYKTLIQKRKSKKRLTKRQKKQLDHELFINYCKCIKKLKYSRNIDTGLEYPYCASSIYTKRDFKVPKGVTKKCKNMRGGAASGTASGAEAEAERRTEAERRADAERELVSEGTFDDTMGVVKEMIRMYHVPFSVVILEQRELSMNTTDVTPNEMMVGGATALISSLCVNNLRPGDSVSGDSVSGDSVSGDSVSGDSVSGDSVSGHHSPLVAVPILLLSFIVMFIFMNIGKITGGDESTLTIYSVHRLHSDKIVYTKMSFTHPLLSLPILENDKETTRGEFIDSINASRGLNACIALYKPARDTEEFGGITHIGGASYGALLNITDRILNSPRKSPLNTLLLNMSYSDPVVDISPSQLLTDTGGERAIADGLVSLVKEVI